MDQECMAMLALHFIPGIGPRLVKQLVSYCGSASEVFRKPPGKLSAIPGVGPQTIDAIARSRPFDDATREWRKAERDHATILFFGDKRFPSRLRHVDDGPSMLYFKGNCNLNATRMVGIVGTRQATSYGKWMVEQLVAELVQLDVVIVSGLAYGIDIHAHKQSLKFGVPTLGVLGSGLDVVYPYQHRDVALRMLDRGGLLTENVYGTRPDAHHFPSRNRIIAGMCDALIVVEAAEKGGALITAEIANSYNRDVFAIPGSIGQPFSEGCNKLIKINKACLLTSARDIEYIMNWIPGQQGVSIPTRTFTPEEERVISTISTKGLSMHIDELAWKSNIPPGTLANLLLRMELDGLVKALPGKKIELRK